MKNKLKIFEQILQETKDLNIGRVRVKEEKKKFNI